MFRVCFISHLITGVGVSLVDKRNHVMREIPGLDETGTSRDTIHILLQPPRKTSTRSQKYKCLTDAKFPGKRNQYWDGSINQHFLFATVSYREEFVFKFADECTFFSCDYMNKVEMGPSPAWAHQHRFFMLNNPHNLGDHDFPNPGYMIACSGNQSLVGKENVCEEEEFWATDLNNIHDNEALTNIDLNIPQRLEGQKTFDRLGRKHYQRFSLGSVHMVLRALTFSPSPAEAHTNDLFPLLTAQVKDGKGITILKIDNGSDWNLLSIVNSLYFFRLWRDSEPDVLGMCSYAVPYSAYNIVEHTWSLMSRRLACYSSFCA